MCGAEYLVLFCAWNPQKGEPLPSLLRAVLRLCPPPLHDVRPHSEVAVSRASEVCHCVPEASQRVSTLSIEEVRVCLIWGGGGRS